MTFRHFNTALVSLKLLSFMGFERSFKKIFSSHENISTREISFEPRYIMTFCKID